MPRIQDHPVAAHERESVPHNWHLLSSGFKRFLLPSNVFALAYLSLGFILLKAYAVGFSVTEIVLLYALFNTICVLTAPLVGRLGDRVGRSLIVMLGYAVYAVIKLWLALADSRWEVVVVLAIYGFFMQLTSRRARLLSPTSNLSGAQRQWGFTTLQPVCCTCRPL